MQTQLIKGIKPFFFFVFFLFFFVILFSFFWWYQTFNKKLITTTKSLAENQKSFLHIKLHYILSFSISFLYLVVILLILCVIPLWDAAPAHSPSCEEFNPSSQKDVRFSGRCTSAYDFHFILHLYSLGLSNSSLTLW